jgi:hypothetical protein
LRTVSVLSCSGRELLPVHVADDVEGGTIQPADDAVRVDDVARDVDVLQDLIER